MGAGARRRPRADLGAVAAGRTRRRGGGRPYAARVPAARADRLPRRVPLRGSGSFDSSGRPALGARNAGALSRTPRAAPHRPGLAVAARRALASRDPGAERRRRRARRGAGVPARAQGAAHTQHGARDRCSRGPRSAALAREPGALRADRLPARPRCDRRRRHAGRAADAASDTGLPDPRRPCSSGSSPARRTARLRTRSRRRRRRARRRRSLGAHPPAHPGGGRRAGGRGCCGPGGERTGRLLRDAAAVRVGARRKLEDRSDGSLRPAAVDGCCDRAGCTRRRHARRHPAEVPGRAGVRSRLHVVPGGTARAGVPVRRHATPPGAVPVLCRTSSCGRLRPARHAVVPSMARRGLRRCRACDVRGPRSPFRLRRRADVRSSARGRDSTARAARRQRGNRIPPRRCRSYGSRRSRRCGLEQPAPRRRRGHGDHDPPRSDRAGGEACRTSA